MHIERVVKNASSCMNKELCLARPQLDCGLTASRWCGRTLCWFVSQQPLSWTRCGYLTGQGAAPQTHSVVRSKAQLWSFYSCLCKYSFYKYVFALS